MANDVYSPTTVSDPKSSFFLGSGSQFLDKVRFPLKVSEVLLSLVAFALEESVSSCSSCHSLYFFEFVSCTAFLFTALLLILLATTLHSKVGLSCWPKVDFFYTAAIAVLLLLSSIMFASGNDGTSVETVAVVFGFLAMAAFCADLVFFLKVNGNPLRRQATPTTNGGPAPPEAEKLNGAP
ncbi:CKLF-like MARVEL transmembrane domain-containing protein 6 isoform X1 [Fundulus heteroclitus]|uniref:CKLF-like MARVEL transmembrane domain-containing protein 6 isoform X1 n=1 Tax=Fundulus heteroclitus TaxID=8078 RepID=UPI00165CE558|nr:CKLF-like MARVEL transmembrane domain-containing protein 6 isoform X1 [Fundulus heteroclitus]